MTETPPKEWYEIPVYVDADGNETRGEPVRCCEAEGIVTKAVPVDIGELWREHKGASRPVPTYWIVTRNKDL